MFSSITLFMSLILLDSLLVKVSTSSLETIRPCCNEWNKMSESGNACLETDDRLANSKLCVQYQCESKTIFGLTSKDSEPFMKFNYCSAENGFPNERPPKSLEELSVSPGGTLTYTNYLGQNFSLIRNGYCLEPGDQNGKVWPASEVESQGQSTLYICMDISRIRTVDEDDPTIIIIYLIITTLCALVLLITLCCFLMAHEKQSIHGWTQFTHVLAFFLLMIFWNLDDSFILAKNTNTPSCKFIAIGSHFFYISLFSWLLIVNYDLRQAFRNIGQKEFRPKFSALSKYLLYSAFGWGIPFVVVCISIGFSIVLYDSDPYYDELDDGTDTIYSPLYGIRGCSLSFRSYWLFLTLPNTILLVLVFILFLKMVKILRRQSKSSKRVSTTVLGVKILFLMGPFWFLDLITLMHAAVTKDEFVWYIMLIDVIVLIQAIPMFVIYICRPDNLLFLQEKYPRLKNIFIGIGKLFCVPNVSEHHQQITNTYEMSQPSSTTSPAIVQLRANRRPSVTVDLHPPQAPLLKRPPPPAATQV